MSHIYTATPYAELKRLLSTPVDPEQELLRAQRKGFVNDDGEIVPVKIVRGGSFLTGTSSEVIYSNTTVGTAKNTFTTEAMINDLAGMGPQPILPPYFFLPSGSAARTVRVVARGVLSTTGAPTFTFSCRGGAAANITTTPQIAASIAVTAGSGQTNSIWEAEFDFQLTVAGATGANSTIRSLGLWTIQLSATTSVNAPLFGAAASPGTVATFDISTTNYIAINAACGTSSGSNSIQLLQLIIMGLN